MQKGKIICGIEVPKLSFRDTTLKPIQVRNCKEKSDI